MAKSKFSERLWIRFEEWQRNQGEKKTLTDFANYLGVKQATLSAWMNSTRTPKKENVERIAEILFDDQLIKDAGYSIPPENEEFDVFSAIGDILVSGDPEKVRFLNDAMKDAALYATKNNLSGNSSKLWRYIYDRVTTPQKIE